MKRSAGPSYPTKASIRRLVDAAKEAGIKIGGVEFAIDGTVRILSDVPAATSKRANDYDDWKRGR